MLGKQVLQQPMFVTFDLNQFVASDHRLRKIDKVLDLSFINEMVKGFYCQERGRASVDPAVFFKMQIIKYFYGIPSDRQLCEDIYHNLAFRWFLRMSLEDAVPDHSSLTKIRDRLGEDLFRDVFERIVRQCQKVGLVKGRQMITDATLIKADAALKSAVSDPNADKVIESSQRPTQLEEPANKKFKEKTSNKTHISTTDPDSSIVGRRPNCTAGLYHKAHVTIDGDSRVITDCFVTTGARHDSTTFLDRMNYQLATFSIATQEWLADRAYGFGPIYGGLRGHRIRSYIPRRDERLGSGKMAPPKDFTYDRHRDVYICPNGRELLPYKPDEESVKYRLLRKQCAGCPRIDECLKGQPANRGKQVIRHRFQDEFDAVRRREKTKNFRKKIRERSWKIEGVFAEDKENHNLGRAQYRGRANVQIQVYLIAIVHNLKRLAGSALGDLFSLFFALWAFMMNWRASKFSSQKIIRTTVLAVA